MRRKPWREAIVRGLIVAELASLLTMVNIAGSAWLTNIYEGMQRRIEGVLFWPLGSLIWTDYFTVEGHFSNEDLRARLTILVAVTWLKYAAIIILIHWFLRKLKWGRLTARRDRLLACACPCTLILALEAPGALLTASGSRAMELLLPVTNLVVLLGIARLPWPRVRRAVCSIPFWLAWIWWWPPLRFTLNPFYRLFTSMPADEALLVVVPLLGFALYALTLDTMDVTTAPPSIAPGSAA